MVCQIVQAHEPTGVVKARVIKDRVTPFVFAVDTVDLTQRIGHRSALGYTQHKAEDSATEIEVRMEAIVLTNIHDNSER